ncbi:diguanylate cyclase domain-containing protein [Terriglobus sp. RCC_193]|uniref:diguanylate cyclase domain-containing protein n=1 Tax=Terriglobus sp. RCC_193 TaxID=3239218 RepID=UPI0035238C02
MNYLLLPDFFAMSLLVGVLLAVRQRHRDREGLRLWIGGLMLILAECAAHIIYMLRDAPLPVHRAAHAIALDAYLLAGILFVFSAVPSLRGVPRRMLVVCTNSLPLLVMLAYYGVDGRKPAVYWGCIVIGAGVKMISCLRMRSWLHFAVLTILWGSIAYFVFEAQYRNAVYVSLALVYLLCAIAFYQSLPRSSRGSVAVIGGFAMWALCFALHPWISQKHPQWNDFAREVWDMQKFIITVGLLVVMLEDQLSSSEWLARHDELTGLPNRRHFDDRLHSLLVRAGLEHYSVSVFTLDLNGFKQVNDTLGHDAGDILLKAVAMSLATTAKPLGLVARQGGDEFSVVVAGADEMENQHIRRLLLEAVEEPVNLGPRYADRTVRVSASIGVAMFPLDAEEQGALMRLADQRMYQQKSLRDSLRRNRGSSERVAQLQSV